MKAKGLIMVSVCLIISMACRKKDDDSGSDETVTKTASYSPLAIGNYWIYGHYKIDTLGNEELLEYQDSIAVTKDTIINGETYYILEGTNKPWSADWNRIGVYRYSSGSLLTTTGIVIFSETDFDNVLFRDTNRVGGEILFTSFYQMIADQEPTKVPAGTFSTLNYRGTLMFTDKIKTTKKERILNNQYARGVGKVKQNYFFAGDAGQFEKKLLRYRIQ